MKYLIPIAISLVVIAGWLFQIEWLTTWGGKVTSKLPTGASIFAVSAGIAFVRQRGLIQSLTSAGCVFMSLWMAMNLINFSLVRQWFTAEPADWANLTVSPGVPSVVTVLLVWIWSQAIFLEGVSGKFEWLTNWAAKVSISCGVIALMGHLAMVFSSHWIFQILVFHVPRVSTGMAIPTALAFLMVGMFRLREVK